jgi:hypothetical protein
MFVRFNTVLLRELCRQVEETDDPKTLIELSGEITRLLDDKLRRLTLARRKVLMMEHPKSAVPHTGSVEDRDERAA